MKRPNKEQESMSSDKKSKGTRRPYKGKRGNSKPKEQEKKLPVLKDDINDSSYYYDDPLIREQITSYSFSQFAGVPFMIHDGSNGAKFDAGVIPTMMRIRLAPAAGATGSTSLNNHATDGIQRAALKNFTKLSANNQKNTNYQPQDITKLILAEASLMEMFSFAQRILGSIYIFNQRNRDLPQELIEAQGIQYSSLRDGYADYLMQFNILVTQFNKIPVPANVKAFAKCSTMYNNFYVDDTSPMAQMFVNVPDGYWVFDETNDKLAYTKLNYSSTVIFSVILSAIRTQLDALLESATFNYIYSDVLRLADKEGMQLLLWSTVPFGYVAPILYSEEYNLWVENLTVAGDPIAAADTYTTPGNDVLMDPLAMKICYKPAILWTANRNLREYPLNFYTNNPDVESRVAATRLISDITRSYPSDPTHKLLCCSDHYVTSLDMLAFQASDVTQRYWLNNGNGLRCLDTAGYSGWQIMSFVNGITKFKHAPRAYYYESTSETTDGRSLFVGDLDFYTTVDNNYLSRMFDVEWLSYMTIQ